MPWQYTSFMIPLLITTIICGTLAFFAWQRGTIGAKLLALFLGVVAEWSLAYALELGSADLSAKFFWRRVQYFGITALPITWLIFSTHFTHRSRWLTQRNLLLVSLFPLLTLLLIWTPDSYGLIWGQASLDTSGPIPTLDIRYGPWFWVYLSYSYALLLIGTILLSIMVIQSIHIYRWQALFLFFGILMPWLGIALSTFNLVPRPYFDLSPFSFAVAGVLISWAFYRFRLLEISPIARSTVVERMNNSVIVLDNRNRVVDLNPAAQRMTGFRFGEAIGQPAQEVLSKWPDLLDFYLDYAEIQTEIVSKQAQGERFFDLEVSLLYDQQQRIKGRLIILRDITHRKKAEQELAKARDQALEASHLKSQLLARVSHELRTPLGAILGFTEMLTLGFYGNISDAQRMVTKDIITSTQELTSLVNELLEQAQLENGKLRLNVINFAPIEIVENIQSRMAALARSKGLRLNIKIAPELPPQIYGDPARLQQILGNLVNNAVKFTDSGEINIKLFQPDADHWALQVSDTGPGIPPEAQAYIFDPFQQVDGSITRAYGGIGLGLSIVKRLTTLMGGYVTVESSVNQGSVFTVCLPLASNQNKVQ